jgi:DNA-directed RNA polymerase subunit K/omega
MWNGKKKEPAKEAEEKKNKPPPIADEEIEDGDFATPKHDHDGNDDEPL